MKLSIVATMYMSAPYLYEFCDRCKAVARQKAGDDYEIILVNDGSPDDSLAIALELRHFDNHIVVIDLSRNYGHHKAVMMGLMHACGERVFLIDCDLEESPELLTDFWERLDANADIDVIYGIQTTRKGGVFEKISGWAFYRIINALSNVKLTPNVIMARLMTAGYVQALTAHKDQEVYLFGLLSFTGFRQEGVQVAKLDKGSSTYTLRKRLSLSINAITNFSNYPLYFIFYTGIGVSTFSFVCILLIFINWIFVSEKIVVGWTSLALSIWAVGGLVLTALGVIGIYLAKIFIETKPRPYAVVRQIYGKKVSNRTLI